MKSRTIAALTLAALLAASLAGCTGQASTDTDENAASAPTLTRDTLPTKVGTKWTMVRIDEDDTHITLTVKGPWEFEAGEGWRTEDYELVDPKTVPGIGDFKDYTYVLRVTGPAIDTYYYPRQVTDKWVISMGRIKETSGGPQTEPHTPGPFWPLGLAVGQTYTIQDTDKVTTKATVLSRNTATVPAGKVEDAYLTRFRTEWKDGSRKPNDYYYLFAPNVGMVAYFSGLTGSEQKGFTAADAIVLLASEPK